MARIDYSLHVLMALQQQRDYVHLYAHIGVPMLTSQPALQNFGLVMDLGIIAAVTACLFLLPVLAVLTARHCAGSVKLPRWFG